MNFHDSERVAGLLEAEGLVPSASSADADVVVINTCSVRERAEEKLYTRLGELRAESAASGSRPLVAVTGCVAQQEGRAIAARSRQVDVIVGTQALKHLPDLLRTAQARVTRTPLVDVNPYEDVSFPLGVARRGDPVRAYVTIIEGCNDFCSFCVVPYTRGHERMRPVADILAEVRGAVSEGRREVQLLGQIVNHYEAPDDASCDFAELLARVGAIDGVERIRFASPHPRHVTGRLIAAIRSVPKVCRHLHLPLQSGSTRVLGLMRRRHTREDYFALVRALREAIPDVALSTDVIVGFPGETDSDFADTLSLVRQVRFHGMFSFKYSPRPNTLASKRYPDDVPEVEKTRRIVALQEAQKAIQTEWHEDMLGRTEEVLVDSVSRRRAHELAGRTGQNTVVNFPGDAGLLGSLVRVRVERAGPNAVWGRLVDPPRAESIHAQGRRT